MGDFEAIILGIVQGLTEFLPISSTAHLRIVPAFLGWDDPGTAFTAVVQLGTMAAVVIYFRDDRVAPALPHHALGERVRPLPGRAGRRRARADGDQRHRLITWIARQRL